MDVRAGYDFNNEPDMVNVREILRTERPLLLGDSSSSASKSPIDGRRVCDKESNTRQFVTSTKSNRIKDVSSCTNTPRTQRVGTCGSSIRKWLVINALLVH